MSRPPFCASCTDERSDLTPRATGRNGGVVWLCPDCDPENHTTLTPARHGPERGYEVPDRDYAATIREIARAAPGGIVTSDRYSGRRATPGFVLERVFRMRAGKNLSRDDAKETLRGNSWFAELRHVGSDQRWHLFERPDVDLARKVRSTSNVDPIGALGGASTRSRR